jgi:S1-C subfamily serine protease
MYRRILIALVAGLGGIAGGASGQEPAGAPRVWTFVAHDHRGRLGMLVTSTADPATDSVGAKLEAVTPGGPAAKAGLAAGDIITKVNGTVLADARAEDEDASGPGRKLIDLARALAPGDTAQIEYRRGGQVRKATLVAADVGSLRGRPDRADLAEPRAFPILPGADGGFAFCFGDAWCDMELVNLNPDLGEYFGTKEGILVVKAPADSSLPLKSGDVILAIGARRPSSASHAMRILRSYEAGETVTIDVMRRQKRTTVTWVVPPQEAPLRRLMRLHGMHVDSDGDPPES